MKLERTLIELSTLVDYGCKYLAEREVMKAEFHSDEWINVADVVNYVVSNYYVDDVFDDDDISAYVKDNLDYFLDSVDLDEFMESKDISTSDVLEGIDLSEYMRVMGLEDVDVLDCLPNSSIIDYVTDRFDMEDVFDVDWENELYSMPEDIINNYIENEYDSTNYLNSLNVETLKDYIRGSYDVADFVEWK